MKKALSLMLALVLVLTAVSAFADGSVVPPTTSGTSTEEEIEIPIEVLPLDPDNPDLTDLITAVNEGTILDTLTEETINNLHGTLGNDLDVIDVVVLKFPEDLVVTDDVVVTLSSLAYESIPEGTKLAAVITSYSDAGTEEIVREAESNGDGTISFTLTPAMVAKLVAARTVTCMIVRAKAE